MKADISIDCLGLYCPLPIVRTAKAIKALQAGQVLELVADDMGIKEDLPNWCLTTGNECLGIEEEGGKYKGYVRKKA